MRTLLVLMGLLCGCQDPLCRDGQAGVRVALSGATERVKRMETRFTLNGQVAHELVTYTNTTEFGLRLPAGASGLLAIELDALDADGVWLGRGRGQVTLAAGQCASVVVPLDDGQADGSAGAVDMARPGDLARPGDMAGPWQAVNVGTERNLYAVWSSGPGDVWIGGSGVLRHSEGGTWREGPLSLGTGATVNSATIFGLWGTSKDRIWAAGQVRYADGRGVLQQSSSLLWNGAAWQADLVSSDLTLYAIREAQGVAWAVGERSRLRNGRVMVKSAGSWSLVREGSEATTIYAIGAFSSVDVKAGGDNYHYSCSSTVCDYSSSGYIRAMWNEWAVGLFGRIWQGGSSVSGPTRNDLYGIWGSSSSDIWAVGDWGTVLRYNGSSWIQVPVGTTENLRAIWGTGPNDIWIVGLNGTVLHYGP